jgi:hypothetical protein
MATGLIPDFLRHRSGTDGGLKGRRFLWFSVSPPQAKQLDKAFHFDRRADANGLPFTGIARIVVFIPGHPFSPPP